MDKESPTDFNFLRIYEVHQLIAIWSAIELELRRRGVLLPEEVVGVRVAVPPKKPKLVKDVHDPDGGWRY